LEQKQDEYFYYDEDVLVDEIIDQWLGDNYGW
jgi:hypothetical protein